MKLSTTVKIVVACVVVFLAVTIGPRIVGRLVLGRWDAPVDDETQYAHSSLIYGRVHTIDGATYEGRLRWGSSEAFWGNYFNGSKKENAWAGMVPKDQLPTRAVPTEVFGFRVSEHEEAIPTRRLFLARFGDLTKITADTFEVRVTLKSGTTVVLDRNEASDFDNSVRVWDNRQGPIDLDSRRIREIEFLAAPEGGVAPERLYGTVQTKGGTFEGFVQWDRVLCLGTDPLTLKSSDGRMEVPMGQIRSIERREGDSLVTLADGRKLSVSGSVGAGDGNNGEYIDDARFGRVLIPWEELQRIDFRIQGSGPAYGDFPRGGPIQGSVKTHDGRVLAGRLVCDLDESETTDTLDAPWQGVNYLVPFGRIASIDLAGRAKARVTLVDGSALELERRGDLGDENGGVLVFADGKPKPEYVRWDTIERLDFVQR